MGAFSVSAMFGVPSLELHAGSRMTVTAASGAAAKPREKTVKSRESDHQGHFRYDSESWRRFGGAMPHWEWT